MLITFSGLNSQLFSSNKIKLILFATPILISSGIYVYYCYKKYSKQKNKKRSNEIIDPLKAKLLEAIELKNKGNAYFRQKNYDEALKLYTEAILLCPPDRKKEISTFYQNRSACYEHLKRYEDVIKDTTKAIEYDKLYVKAYLRRGKANEILENFEDASYDYYVASNASQFQNSDYMKLLTECMDKYAFKRAQAVMAKRKAYTFQKYLFKHLLNKFTRDPLKKREQEILKDYDRIINQLLSDSNDENLNQNDLLLKGTIELYIGRHEGKNKLLKIIETVDDVDYKVNALLKLAEYGLQNNKLEDSEKYLKDAVELDPNNADVYYVRSELHIINGKHDESIADLKKATELEPKFVVAIGQRLYIRYQQCLVINNFIGKNQILKEFEETIEQFPGSNELLLLCLQVLLSDNQTKKADSLIMKAIDNDPEDPTLYVYKSLIFIEENSFNKTKEYLARALELDPRCSFAYDILSTLLTKVENFRDAYDYLEKAINNSTTFEDAKNLILKQKALDMQLKSQSLF